MFWKVDIREQLIDVGRPFSYFNPPFPLFLVPFFLSLFSRRLEVELQESSRNRRTKRRLA